MADARFARLLALRDEVNKELEIHRQQGEFGKSLEACLLLAGDLSALSDDLAACAATLEELCIVSQVEGGAATVASQVYPGLSIAVRRAEGTPCPRCWQVHRETAGHEQHPDLCDRCLEVVQNLEEWKRS